ncbi:MAG: hypothetical protein V1850_00780 [Candidatus Bathyarchaeota archaeon]
MVEFEPKAGRGSSSVGVPDAYSTIMNICDEVCAVKANVITPKVQSLANMEKDYRLAAERLVKETDETIQHGLSLIARAYEPCISFNTAEK